MKIDHIAAAKDRVTESKARHLELEKRARLKELGVLFNITAGEDELLNHLGGWRLCLRPYVTLEWNADEDWHLRRFRFNRRGKARMPEYSGTLGSAKELIAQLDAWKIT